MQKQKGISTLAVIIIIVVVAIVVVGGVFAYQYFSAKTQPVVQTQQNQNQNNQTAQPSINITLPNGGDIWQAVNDVNTIKWTYNGINDASSASVEIVDQNNKTVCDVSEGFVSLKDKQLIVSHDYLSVSGCVGNNRRVQMIFHGNQTTTPNYDVTGYSGYFSIVAPTNQTAGWKTYTNTEYGFEIKYPSSWSGSEQPITMSNLGELAYFKAVYMSVIVWNTSKYSYDELKMPPPGGINPDTIKQENIAISGYPATKFSYTSVGDASSGTKSYQQLSINKNQLVFVINCSGQDCNQIISTFKFTK